MTKSLCILVILSFMAAIACLAPITGAQGCATCGAEQNWDASASSFLEGKSVENVPAPKWGPAVVREKNSQFSTNSTKDGANKTSGASDNAAQKSAEQEPSNQAQIIVLRNASATPNPASPGSSVTIAAILGGASSAYALINNFAGVQVGNVTLEQTSGEEYVGTWQASIATGPYKAAIIASGQGLSRTFNDALEMDVEGSSGSSGNDRFKKLG